jgi:hypothetical protein
MLHGKNFPNSVLTAQPGRDYIPAIDDGNAGGAAANSLLEQSRVRHPTQVGVDACSARGALFEN